MAADMAAAVEPDAVVTLQDTIMVVTDITMAIITVITTDTAMGTVAGAADTVGE
jgi:hypothetical protein